MSLALDRLLHPMPWAPRPAAPSPFFDFLGLAAALAALLGIDTAQAGYVLGGALTMALFLAVVILLSDLEVANPSPVMFVLAVGLILSVLFLWWPVWTLLIAALFILAGVAGIFRSGGP